MSSPSHPVDISSPRLRPGSQEVLVGTPASQSHTPDLRALRAQFGTPPVNLPLRPHSRNEGDPEHSSSVSFTGRGLASESGLQSRRVSEGSTARPVVRGGNGDSDTPPSRGERPEELPEDEVARVLRRHLVSREERNNRVEARAAEASDATGTSAGAPSSSQGAPRRQDSEAFPIAFSAPGGDVTHDIYKWQADQQRQAYTRSRSASFSGAPQPVDPAFEHIHEPGGFRRNYLLLHAAQQSAVEPPRMVNNFIEFLYIFGHFAGEDLEEDDDDELGDEDYLPTIPEEDEYGDPAHAEAGMSSSFMASSVGSESFLRQPTHVSISGDATDRTPLLRSASVGRSNSRSRRRRRANSVHQHGDATVTQAVLMLLKSFVGTGVLFLGKAFMNGGILFSSATIVFIALISLYSFLLLVKTKFVVSGSFGDIGGALYGPWMRFAILFSITISQIGFVAAYTIFVAENLRAFVMAVSHCLTVIPVQYLIAAQLLIILPAALVRNIAKLSTTALVADVFILAGLLYIFGSEAVLIGKRGVADVQLFNPKDFPLLIGTAVFSFEGIGLVIPITDAMKEPRKFPGVLTGVMLFLTVLFAGAGALAYAAFGSEIQTVVIVNLDSTSKLVQAVQLLYSLAILLSIPLQLFPAVRIIENGIFSARSGKGNVKVKWMKNFFRFGIVVFCTIISSAGAQDLDKFVAFVGSFACVPLCYVYPAMLHYKACARTKKQKVADIALMIFGAVAAVYTTVQTIRLMVEPAGEGGGPVYGGCDGPAPRH